MRIVRFISISAIGFLLGFAGWHFSNLGYFQRWEKLPVTPQDIPGYFSVSKQKTYPGLVEITKPCDYSTVEFSLLAKPPDKIADCLQRLELDPEGSMRITYVLDIDTSVWKWEYIDNTNAAFLSMLCLPSSGLLIGIGIAFLVETSKFYVNRT